jgi:hypothetical protein
VTAARLHSQRQARAGSGGPAGTGSIAALAGLWCVVRCSQEAVAWWCAMELVGCKWLQLSTERFHRTLGEKVSSQLGWSGSG